LLYIGLGGPKVANARQILSDGYSLWWVSYVADPVSINDLILLNPAQLTKGKENLTEMSWQYSLIRRMVEAIQTDLRGEPL
jgi:hypothetical protein